MSRRLQPTDVHRLASIELNFLHLSRALPSVGLEGARLDVGTPVFDINGTLLFMRYPLVLDGATFGYADAAAQTALGAPLLAVAPGAVWDEQAVLGEAREAFRAYAGVSEKRRGRGRGTGYDEVRIVAYSFPKLAVQFLREREEVAMLECFSWTPVPPARRGERRARMRPANFERWSLLDEMDAGRRSANHRKFEQRIRGFERNELDLAGSGRLASSMVQSLIDRIRFSFTNELHYSGRSSDHHVCYELRGQETSVWCVAASVQMLLDFYRYNYSQSQIAQRLGLGTLSNPNGLPYANVGDVVTQLQAMSSGALTASMIVGPALSDFTSELSQNRPMISFIPGHSRTVAGTTESLFVIFGFNGFRGLLVYDPWPPNTGVITRWENFDTQMYQYAYSARVTTI